MSPSSDRLQENVEDLEIHLFDGLYYMKQSHAKRAILKKNDLDNVAIAIHVVLTLHECVA